MPYAMIIESRFCAFVQGLIERCRRQPVLREHPQQTAILDARSCNTWGNLRTDGAHTRITGAHDCCGPRNDTSCTAPR